MSETRYFPELEERVLPWRRGQPTFDTIPDDLVQARSLLLKYAYNSKLNRSQRLGRLTHLKRLLLDSGSAQVVVWFRIADDGEVRHVGLMDYTSWARRTS